MNLDHLKNRECYLVIDKSSSMHEKDCVGGVSRWKACEESTVAIADRLNELDPDGITIVPFATTFKTYENTTPATVKNIFRENDPFGSTYLAPPLEWVFKDYNDSKKAGKAKANGAIVLVVTDGCPQDENDVAKAITKFSKTLGSDSEVGISFLQVGKDPVASQYLKRLDNSLTHEGAQYDIVNTKTFEEMETIGLTEALLAALSH